MSEGIFLSYRRDDTRHVAGRLAGDLADRFGHEAIFRDVESIDGGEEFPVKLDRALAGCAMMLVLIGPKWLTVTDAHGQRRLDLPGDWVRQEIAAALQRDIRVVPVLVEDTPLPDEAELPEDLRPLVKRQARMLSDERWAGDLQAMVDMLTKVPGLKLKSPAPAAAAPLPVASAPPAGGNRFAMMGAGAVVMLLVIVGLAMWSGDDEGNAGTAVAAAPAGGWPDLHGPWRTGTEIGFYFEQNGPEVKITVREHDEEVGSGDGFLHGETLKLRATFRDEDDVPSTLNCDLKAVGGYSRFEGPCTATDGSVSDNFIQR